MTTTATSVNSATIEPTATITGQRRRGAVGMAALPETSPTASAVAATALTGARAAWPGAPCVAGWADTGRGALPPGPGPPCCGSADPAIGVRPVRVVFGAWAKRSARRRTSSLRPSRGASAHPASSSIASSARAVRSGSSRASRRIVTASRSGGTPGRTADGSGMGLKNSWASASRVSPTNRRCPVSISHSMMPTANRSLRPSSAPPLACSGDMYAGLPLMMCDAVAALWARALAMPKSDTLIAPSHDTSTLCGDTSRWTRPRMTRPSLVAPPSGRSWA